MRIRRIPLVLAALGLVAAACGSRETDTSGERDRNAPVENFGDVAFGVNDNGVAVNALRSRTFSVEQDLRVVTLRDGGTVYATLSVLDGVTDVGDKRDAELSFRIVRMNGLDQSVMKFDGSYGAKTIKTSTKPIVGDRFLPTENGYAIHAVNQHASPSDGPKMMRYRLDTGLLDTAFGKKGTIQIPQLQPDIAAGQLDIVDVADQADGRIVALVKTSPDFFLVRFQSNGSLDPTFGTGGITALPVLTDPVMRATFTRVIISEGLSRPSVVHVVGTGFRGVDEARLESQHLLDLRFNIDGVLDQVHLDTQLGDPGATSIPLHAVLADVQIDRSSTTSRGLSGKGFRIAPSPLMLGIDQADFVDEQWERHHSTVVWDQTKDVPSATVEEMLKFDDRARAFSPVEREVNGLRVFSTYLAKYSIGFVANRSSNFLGLGVGRATYGEFPLSDVQRIADYQVRGVIATRLRSSANGGMSFSLVGMGQNDQLGGLAPDAGDIGLVQANWGVSMTPNGEPVAGFGGDNVSAKNPVTSDYLTSFFATERPDSLGRSFTIMGDDNAMYVLDTETDGADLHLRRVDLAKKSLGPSVTLETQDAFPSWLPSSPDALEVRGGFLYIATEFWPTQPWPWVSGVARYALTDGKLDRSYGVNGVLPLAPAWQIPRNKILTVRDDGSVDVMAQFWLPNKRVVNVWSGKPTAEFDIADFQDGVKIVPKNFTMSDDVYSDGTTEGPIGYTSDTQGRLLVARVRRVFSVDSRTVDFTMRVWRYTANGVLDESFGDGGRAEYDVFGWSQVAPAIDQPPQLSETANGRILLGFLGIQASKNPAGGSPIMRDVHVLARLTSAGVVDGLKPPKPASIPIEVIQEVPAGQEPAPVAVQPSPAQQPVVPVVAKLDEKPVVIPSPPAAAQVNEPQQLKIIAMTNAVDRSIGVKWAIPESLKDKSVEFEVTAEPGGKTCTTASTLCVFRGLDAWNPYSFRVAVKSGADGISASDPSTPIKPLRLLARKKTVKTSSLLTPGSNGKSKWRVSGGCALSKNNSMLTTPNDATICQLTVRTARSGKTPAFTRSITIDVRAVVN